jgi:hypothetical protein
MTDDRLEKETADKPLAVYLNDHLAGATFGADLARQLADRTAHAPFGPAMRTLADEIEADRETLRELMERLDVSPSAAKQATTWLGEKLSRIKLTGRSAGHEELGLFLALETLSLGVEGKASLWSALRLVADRYPPLSDVDLATLEDRARRQRSVLESERAASAERAFTGP